MLHIHCRSGLRLIPQESGWTTTDDYYFVLFFSALITYTVHLLFVKPHANQQIFFES